ncbi:MAG: aspartate carbamoyltransferase catalytic subunit, partial [Steroidobacteraceae bacterium]
MSKPPAERTEQLRADGSLRHLLTLDGLSRGMVESLLERAAHFSRPFNEPAARSTALRGTTVAIMFAEPSTRTRVSFELAALRLGADVVNIEVQLSSRR